MCTARPSGPYIPTLKKYDRPSTYDQPLTYDSPHFKEIWFTLQWMWPYVSFQHHKLGIFLLLHTFSKEVYVAGRAEKRMSNLLVTAALKRPRLIQIDSFFLAALGSLLMDKIGATGGALTATDGQRLRIISHYCIITDPFCRCSPQIPFMQDFSAELFSFCK